MPRQWTELRDFTSVCCVYLSGLYVCVSQCLGCSLPPALMTFVCSFVHSLIPSIVQSCSVICWLWTYLELPCHIKWTCSSRRIVQTWCLVVCTINMQVCVWNASAANSIVFVFSVGDTFWKATHVWSEWCGLWLSPQWGTRTKHWLGLGHLLKFFHTQNGFRNNFFKFPTSNMLFDV